MLAPPLGRARGGPVSFLPLATRGVTRREDALSGLRRTARDDHSGRTRIAGSWRISGCAAPTRRATRHLRPYAFNGSVGPARSLSAAGGLPAAARGRGLC